LVESTRDSVLYLCGRWCCQNVWGRNWKASEFIFWTYWMGHRILILVRSTVLPCIWKSS